MRRFNLDETDFVVKLHSKRDISGIINFLPLRGSGWRRRLLAFCATPAAFRRSLAAFARDLGIAPAPDGAYSFLAPDGPHKAFLLSDNGPLKTVRLEMKDVTDYRQVKEGWFVDTGTRHLVTFVNDVDAVDVEGLGKKLRHLPAFAPEGVNVNFVERVAPGEIAVRTFEKGVEAETLACGTGITASAIAAWLSDPVPSQDRPTVFRVHARRYDLEVSFKAPGFRFVTLTGPAERVARIFWEE